MASSSTATADTLITLKVNFDGVTRRFKLPLRDMGASTLEDKLRSFLQIPIGTKTVVERYSDSAAAYIVLESNNLSVYKQLFRAAKAKQKLKLRVCTPAKPEQSKGPQPVTVEDEPETASSEETKLETTPPPTQPEEAPEAFTTTGTNTVQQTSGPSTPVSNFASTSSVSRDTIVAPQEPKDFPDFIKIWRGRGMPRIHLRRDENGVEVIDFCRGASAIGDPMVTLEPLLERSSRQHRDETRYRFSQTASTLSFAELITQTWNSECSSDREEVQTAPASIVAPVQETKKPELPVLPSRSRRPFTVCCNSCEKAVPDAHFHCSTCDDGDFDLCQDCVDLGITCHNDQHWLIKRTITDGQITYSTTHVAPKAIKRPQVNLPMRTGERQSITQQKQAATPSMTVYNLRTCNSCVQEFPDSEFLHCTTCEDYDLCRLCFKKDQHGHHPKHGFAPAVAGTVFDRSISSRLSPGRSIAHNAICDGCENYVTGVRHKCLDCPDWDYCSECVQNAGFIHPNHRFVAIYEPLADAKYRSMSNSTHAGICCDGPLCTSSQSGTRYIVGDRYKCAVCHDTDFCANCEASPANTHNKTHPLIKFRTPVRHVNVTTTGEHEDGKRLPRMGDRPLRSHRTSNRSTETVPSPCAHIAVNPVQTVVDVKPTEPVEVTMEPEAEVKKEVVEPKPKMDQIPDLVAVFKHDTVEDGTVMPPNHTFEQTWVMKNHGQVAWPAGCSVKFVGGDYMGAVDPSHPAGIHELISASESTVCYNQLQPGQEFPFTVLMRTPEREGKVISYWRLTTSHGIKFGHKLWCDVSVEASVPVRKEEVSKVKEEAKEESLLDSEVPDMAKSQMIIPKLEHESPASSIHEATAAKAESDIETATETDTLAHSTYENEDGFEECGDDDEWAQDSDDGFMTDEEYDILDASDEEYLTEQHEQVSRK